MSKRMRCQSPEVTSRSQSSDSQGGTVDAEGTEGMGPYSGTSQPRAALLNKKRTRTRMTPHQSHVLHAMLAQTRFPTTAMREEVGCSIGMSSRKIQIWFQNQRQKSRRQSDIPQRETPHYSSFNPNASSSYPNESEYTMLHRGREGCVDSPLHSGYPHSEQIFGSVEPPPQLLRTGVSSHFPRGVGSFCLHLPR
ncbi:hypothetical protein B0H13DRAFT_924126 [Mycena leptocephala]|nr:hypothetical protein B0H13DRAFT_924126 [Mycena leptocephala]